MEQKWIPDFLAVLIVNALCLETVWFHVVYSGSVSLAILIIYPHYPASQVAFSLGNASQLVCVSALRMAFLSIGSRPESPITYTV